jgi:DNA-directed RNA polymerase specialized sigma subunit
VNISIEKIVEIGVQVGVREALDRISKEKEEKRKSRYDRRLRNTDLLLKNYNKFVAHCNTAIYTSKQLKQANAVDLLDEVEDQDDEVYVQSIMRTKERTFIIVNHIKRIISYYKFITRSEPENERKFNVIVGLYVNKKTFCELGKELYCSTKTVERDRKEAIEELSVLIFGVDGLKLEA